MNADKKDNWIETFTGKHFDVFDPRIEDICIEDIAHSLSMQCRFNGHCAWFYSVAQHSVYVSKLVPPEFALEGLLHDAAETYIGDLLRPIKTAIPEFKIIEEKIQAVIAAKFRIENPSPGAIKHIDDVLLATEAKALGMNKKDDWYLPHRPAEIVIGKRTWRESEMWFLKHFEELERI